MKNYSCPRCGGGMIVPDETVKGQRIVCPHCKQEIVYGLSARPTRVAIPQRFSGGGVPPKRKTTGQGLNGWVAVVLVVVIAGIFGYWFKTKDSGTDEKPDNVAVSTDEQEAENRKREQEEFERKRQEQIAKDQAERERRRAEKEARDAENKKRLADMQKKADAEKAQRNRAEKVKLAITAGKVLFAVDFPEDQRPFAEKNEATIYGVDSLFVSDGKIYEARMSGGNLISVQTLSSAGKLEDYSVDSFRDAIKSKKLLALTEDGTIWLCGTEKRAWSVKATILKEIKPAEIELGGFTSVLNAIGNTPVQKFRITLKNAKSGDEVRLGVIDYYDKVPIEKIKDVCTKKIAERRNKKASIKPPKLKKFKPTVVLYDGYIIRRELKVTKVPREFKHIGTKHYGTVRADTYAAAKRQWQELHDEAERQQRRQQEIQAENAEKMRAYEEKVRELVGKTITGEEIEAEAEAWTVLIERSRSKLDK